MSNLFRKSSLEKLASPDHLDKIVSISSPSIWILVSAGAIMISALMFWIVLGESVEYVSISGAYMSQENSHDKVIGFAPIKDSAHIEAGSEARIAPLNMTSDEEYIMGVVTEVVPNYMTIDELQEQFHNDNLAEYFQRYFNGEPVVEVHIKLQEGELEDNILVKGSIITKRESPGRKIFSHLLR